MCLVGGDGHGRCRQVLVVPRPFALYMRFLTHTSTRKPRCIQVGVTNANARLTANETPAFVSREYSLRHFVEVGQGGGYNNGEEGKGDEWNRKSGILWRITEQERKKARKKGRAKARRARLLINQSPPPLLSPSWSVGESQKPHRGMHKPCMPHDQTPPTTNPRRARTIKIADE